jgi:predicted acylesterase/phospholipase RssA
MIESLFRWEHIKRGEILYNKGDIGDSLYILVNGLLHVIDEERSDPNRVLATIGRGKIVGEMAILSDEIRTASIHAARDCDLVKLSRTSFENISEKFPQVMMAITRILVDRLKDIRAGREPQRSAISFVVLPITPGVDATAFSRRLADAFSVIGKTSLLTSKSLDGILNHKGISMMPENDPREPGLRAKLAEIETSHAFAVYQADGANTTWTRRSLARADKIVFLADAGASPDITAIERDIQGEDHMTTTPRKVLALMHPPETEIPSGTARWLKDRPIRGHYHLRWDRGADFSRLARILSNRAIGLVLGGGAAKGIAHIGVIKALEDAGIPIDMVGGASMGSIIGAHYAMGNNYESMLELCKKLFIEINPFNEYTIPLVSLMRGRKLEKMGRLAYGDNDVEDLWLNYFCVSSNLTTSQVKVHRTGSLWKAVRTSSSIPGIISPVLEDGEIFVDGGVINNLPGDIMRRQCGVVIVVEVSPNLDLSVKVNEIPSPWKLLWQRLIPFKKRLKIPSIVDILLSTVLTGSFIAANSVKLDADLSLTPPLSQFGFLDFKKMRRIAESGHQYTREVLEHIDDEKLLDSLKGV